MKEDVSLKNNHLVMLDLIVGFVLLPLCIVIKFARRFFGRIFSTDYHGTLIIKFLGAGNFVALQDTITGAGGVDIISAKSNLNALKEFGIGQKIHLIDDSNILNLFISSLICCIRLSFRSYNQVINLETESKFAKLITAITSAKIISGVSNVHKSYIDYLLYDKYLVNPVLLGKPEIIKFLGNFDQVTNVYVEYALNVHRERFLKNISLKNVKKILVSAAASNTDTTRRLSINSWRSIFELLSSVIGVELIDVVFSSKDDEQYLEFSNLILEFQSIHITITKYQEFIDCIKGADLVITIDSQALHIAQHFHKPTIAIYGPSSPFGVNFTHTTYPLTRSLICSPCFHKYLRLPCEGTAPCMNFKHDHFDVLRNINK